MPRLIIAVRLRNLEVIKSVEINTCDRVESWTICTCRLETRIARFIQSQTASDWLAYGGRCYRLGPPRSHTHIRGCTRNRTNQYRQRSPKVNELEPRLYRIRERSVVKPLAVLHAYANVPVLQHVKCVELRLSGSALFTRSPPTLE